MNTEQFRKKINVNEPFNANFKLINNPVFRKAMENVEKQIYLACNNQSKKQLFGASTNNITIFFSENLLAVEMKKRSTTAVDPWDLKFRVGYQSNHNLMHHYEHSENQPNP